MTSSYRPDERFSFEVVEEDADQARGYVPSWPLGTKQDEFARRYGLPFEATQGYRAALYPEYEQQLVKQMQATAAQAPGKGNAQRKEKAK
jgi:hypothetical protein